MASVGETFRSLFPRRGKAGSFREIVDARYRHDLVMNGVSAFLVLMVPVGVLAIVYILAGTDTAYGVMEDYLDKAVVTCLALESFFMTVIMFRMYDRLRNHSIRDLEWMRYLIGYAQKKGADTSRMTGCYEECVAEERFVMRPYAILNVIATTMFTGWAIIGGVSRVDDISGGNDFVTLRILNSTLFSMDVVHLVIAVSMVLIFFMAITVFVPSYLFPHSHELRQIGFTRALTDALGERGISIIPMEERVYPSDRTRVILFTVFTAGYGSLFMMFAAFRHMNVHMINQWDYEARLLVSLHTEGRAGFERRAVTEELSEVRTDLVSRLRDWYRTNISADVAYADRMPLVLLITELFLLALLANYVLKLIAMGCAMSEELLHYDYSFGNLLRLPLHGWYNIGMVFLDLYFIILMIDSILGISSRKAQSWRKVVRCCFTVVVPLWYSAFVTRVTGVSHLFDFNVYITTAVLYDILLLMLLSDRIKRYYTPIGYEMPGTVSWIKYAFWGDIFSFVVDRGALFAEDAFVDPGTQDSDPSGPRDAFTATQGDNLEEGPPDPPDNG